MEIKATNLIGVLVCAFLPRVDGNVPIMGWSSWNTFASDVTEAKLLEVMDAMAPLTRFGYQYVNLDDGWQASTRSLNGSLIADPELFPHGVAFLAEVAHAKGLKFGLYTARGNQTCLGHLGSRSFEDIDMATFATWGVDFVKVDSCSGYDPLLSQWQQFRRFRDALENQSRHVLLNICPFGNLTSNLTRSPSCCGCNHLSQVYHVLDYIMEGSPYGKLADSTLIEWQNNQNEFFGNHSTSIHGLRLGQPHFCAGWVTNLDAARDLVDSTLYEGVIDLDILVVGCNNLTTRGPSGTPCAGYESLREQRAHFTFWCLYGSPLILGFDPRWIHPDIYDIITNQKLIDIQRDPLNDPVRVVRETRMRQQQVFVKKLKGNRVAAVLFNRGNDDDTIDLERSDLPLDDCSCFVLTNIWDKRSVRSCERAVVFSAMVLPHEAIALEVKCSHHVLDLFVL